MTIPAIWRVEVPAAVLRLAGDDAWRPVWRNEVGGLTFEVGRGHRRRFIKWAPAGSGLDLRSEPPRLAWAAPFTRVPRVLDQGRDGYGEWLVTSALPGRSAVSPSWTRRPAQAVAAIGAGLARMHDALPVAACRFSWSAEDRLKRARQAADEGRLDPSRWHPENRGLTVAEALRRLADPPPPDRTVVCHGDACAPNTLVGPGGRCLGHVDLGALGVADRWADLAVATWSATWNYGPGWEEALLAAYGVKSDPSRLAYYRLLWDLGD